MDRHIPLSGARNFRDFGGYPTRGGGSVRRAALYRADSLSALDDGDLQLLEPLGIRTICDLRRGGERERSPSRWCSGADTTNLHLPLLLDDTPGNTGTLLADARALNSEAGSRELMKTVYRNMVTDPHALRQIARIFELAADPGALPLLIHCSGGKDRTGVCCALLLTLLDVDTALVMEDYMLSLRLYTDRLRASDDASSQVVDIARAGSPVDAALKPIYAVEPAYLQSVWGAIAERHGTMHAFFTGALGLDRHHIAAIRANLVE